MENDILGIVVPVYNVEDYISECIESIKCQSWTAWKLILVDDGSTDKSGDICDYYASHDYRIKVVHQSNMGLVNARRTGVQELNTDYVTFVDADDWIDPDAYAHMMEIAYKYHPEIITAGIKRYYTSDKIHIEDNMIEEGLYNNEMLETIVKPNMLWRKDTNYFFLDPSLCTKLFLRDRLLEVFADFQDKKIYYAEDSCIFFPYMLSVISLYCTHKAFYYHRQKQKIEHIPAYINDNLFFDKLYVAYDYLRTVFVRSRKLYANELLRQLDLFFIASVRYKERCYKEFYDRIKHEYLFPFAKVPVNSNIILYGAGNVGRAYYQQISDSKFCNIVAWVDKYNNQNADKVDVVIKCSYDFVVIAIESECVCHEVAKELCSTYKISSNKILW